MKVRSWIWRRFGEGLRGLRWAPGAGQKGQRDRKAAPLEEKTAEEILFQMKFGKR